MDPTTPDHAGPDTTLVAAVVGALIIAIMLYLEYSRRWAQQQGLAPRAVPAAPAGDLETTGAPHPAPSHKTTKMSMASGVAPETLARAPLTGDDVRRIRAERLVRQAPPQPEPAAAAATHGAPAHKPQQLPPAAAVPSRKPVAARVAPVHRVTPSPREDDRLTTTPISDLSTVLGWIPGLDAKNAANGPRRPRPKALGPKLLVCHDMMGGYKQDKHPQVS